MPYINKFAAIKPTPSSRTYSRGELEYNAQDPIAVYDDEFEVTAAIKPRIGFADNEYAEQDGNTQIATPIMVYGRSDKVFTPRYLIEEVKASVSDTVGNCSISERVYLQLFKAAVRELTLLKGNRQYNFLIARFPIFLEEGRGEYNLPSSYHKDIAVWAEKPCKYYDIKKRFVRVQRQEWTQRPEGYIYTTEGYKILFKPPSDLNNARCDSCDDGNIGELNMEFYMLPDPPESLDEPMYWLPKHSAAEAFLLEILKERVYERSGRTYISEKSLYRDALLEWDNNLNPADPTIKKNKNLFNYTKY